MSKFKPGDRVKKQIKVLTGVNPIGRTIDEMGDYVDTKWLHGEVLACDVRGHLTIRWDGDSKLEASHEDRVEAV